QMGGHSLKATLLAAKIQTVFNVTMPLVEVFKKTTIKEQAEYINQIKHQKKHAAIHPKNLVPIRQNSPGDHHLFFVHDGSGEIDGYIEFCECLTAKFNYWGIQMDKMGSYASYAPQNRAIEEIACEYIKKIKKVQPHGPYYICGWSLGGTIAVEIVNQLEHENQVVSFLALIDVTSPPGHSPKNEIDFTMQTESEWIKRYLGDSDEIKRIIAKNAGIRQLWNDVVDYLAAQPGHDWEAIKKSIPPGIARVIPNFHRLEIKQAIYYLNRIRSLNNARNRYTPGEKPATAAHFFAADRSVVLTGSHWAEYFQKPLKIHKIKGDHFSIFQKPEVIEFARIFEQVLQEVEKPFKS
ncbi:MAG TPA: thioesterase domain-containing protein, partial [Candidatus Kapabacteria bacterium]|nr:thioesterase domain-containing protein [Candidatus Kapabacteria bacterium]